MNPNLRAALPSQSFISVRALLAAHVLLAFVSVTMAKEVSHLPSSKTSSSGSTALNSQQLGAGGASTAALLNPNVTFEAVVYDIQNTG
jgi:hypothetical protein